MLNDAEIIQEFIQETREHLQGIEPDLLEIEKQGENASPQIVNRIFRAIHSTKGGASFLSFHALKDFSHTMENALILLREGKIAANSHVVDVLLRSVDVIRTMIDDLQHCDQVECSTETQLLQAIVSNQEKQKKDEQQVATPPPQSKPPEPKQSKQVEQPLASEQNPFQELGQEFNVSSETIHTALSEGMNIYLIEVRVSADLSQRGMDLEEIIQQSESIGRCLWCSHEPEAVPQLESDSVIKLIVATVLEPDLVSTGLEIPIEQIKKKDRDKLLNTLKQKPVKPQVAASTPQRPTRPTKIDTRKEFAERKGAKTLRVRVDLLNRLMNMAGELVLGRNQLLRTLSELGDVPGLAVVLQNLDRVTVNLQENIMQTRMQPISILFGRFQRVARDMARSLDKEIELQTEGADVELDKSILEMLADPLVHIIRNCVDHAIEKPAPRLQQGKPSRGRISLLAFHEGGQVNIVISDDGRGISHDKVKAKALEQEIVSIEEANNLSRADIVHLIMAPGFSTAEEVSELSGRGVGMDVVKTNIEKLNGNIEIETAEGKGTTVLISLPLTLAIIPSLVVGVSGLSFAIPQLNIVELVLVHASEVAKSIEFIHGKPVLRLRGNLMPLVCLADVLGLPKLFTNEAGEVLPDRRQRIADRRTENKTPDKKASQQRSGTDRRQSWRSDYYIAVLRAGHNQFGAIIDHLYEPEEIVVKPLPMHLKHVRCFSGTTILGDGRVIMILDTLGIADMAQLKFSEIRDEEKRRSRKEKRSKNLRRHSVVLFQTAPGEMFAVEQKKVLRLENFQRRHIQSFGGQQFLQYRGAGLPIVWLDQLLPVKQIPDDTREMYLIIPKYFDQTGRPKAKAGIIASAIIDAFDIEVELQEPIFQGPGLEGCAILDGKLTVFFDPIALLNSTGVIAESG